jgi:hypothetical protein
MSTDVQDFIKKDNIDTIWEVIIDSDIFKFLTRDIQVNILKLFNQNIKGFFEVERTKTTNLIEMNKKYILLILNYIKKNYPHNMPNKIKIYNEFETKEPITYEEIQNEKKTQFESDFMKRQQEFTNAMTLAVPETPEFKDKYIDEPINEMEKIIKEMTAKRNYDVEQINRSYQKDSDQWLKSQETSIKSEKFIFDELQKQQDKNQGRFKYLNNDNLEKGKSVSWGENQEFQMGENQEFQMGENQEFQMGENQEFQMGKNQEFQMSENLEDDIFKKLKKVKTFENIHLVINEKTFEERLTNIEEKLEIYNDKIDKVLQLLKN